MPRLTCKFVAFLLKIIIWYKTNKPRTSKHGQFVGKTDCINISCIYIIIIIFLSQLKLKMRWDILVPYVVNFIVLSRAVKDTWIQLTAKEREVTQLVEDLQRTNKILADTETKYSSIYLYNNFYL